MRSRAESELEEGFFIDIERLKLRCGKWVELGRGDGGGGCCGIGGRGGQRGVEVKKDEWKEPWLRDGIDKVLGEAETGAALLRWVTGVRQGGEGLASRHANAKAGAARKAQTLPSASARTRGLVAEEY